MKRIGRRLLISVSLAVSCLLLVILLWPPTNVKSHKKDSNGNHMTTRKSTFTKTRSVSFVKKTDAISGEKPITHIAYLKVHKVASGTMQNLFLRFGIKHHLIFVLPKETITINQNSKFSIASRVLPPPRNRTYDILCNHIQYNRSDFEKTLPADTVYIGTVRDPFRQFISSILYYHRKFMLNVPGDRPILEFLQHPEKYRTIIKPETQQVTSKIYNSMAWDFGFPFNLFVKPDEQQINSYLQKLDEEFDLVIVVEYFHEGLILMRRLLHWDMSDILYVTSHKSKFVHPRLKVGPEEESLYRKWCKLDYALFNFFRSKFLRQWQKAVGNTDVEQELAYFKEFKEKVDQFCQRGNPTPSIHIKPTKWHRELSFDKQYCRDRQFGEIAKINEIRNKQISMIRK